MKIICTHEYLCFVKIQTLEDMKFILSTFEYIYIYIYILNDRPLWDSI